MADNSLTLRDLQRQETFERLYETALAEFHRVGVDAARVSEICRQAKVAKGTFFFHFPLFGSNTIVPPKPRATQDTDDRHQNDADDR